MVKFTTLILLMVGLTGCIAPIEPYGNFIGYAPSSLNETLAADTVKQLVTLYPPASTRFNFGQTTPDTYGTLLVELLRAEGYALLEFKPAPTTETTRQEPTADTLSGLNLHYVLDVQARDVPDGQGHTNFYRVTVIVGPTSLSRAYKVQDGVVFPAGAWVRKE